MKKIGINPFLHGRRVKKLLLTMKLTIILFIVGLMQVSATVYSQATKFNFRAENKQIVEVLKQVEETSDFRFFYIREQVNVERKVSVNIKNATVEEILEELFKNKGINYRVMEDNLVLLSPEDISSAEAKLLQQQSITGKVTDESGEPLPGVTVLIKGTTKGTVTNFDGNYTISNLPEGATLVFSFVGMLTQEVEVGTQTSINITMETDAIGIEEVVAVGYGTQKKVNLTGAVATVSGEVLEDRPITNVNQGIQGVMPGVNINFSQGKVGEKGNINIRGVTGLNSGGTGATNGSPLILVDGVVMDMNEINPNDIESISVLKDAASAAIYGARANNGVILITTHGGKKGDIKVRVSSSMSFSKPSRIPDQMTGYENALGIQEATSTSMHKGGNPRFSEEELQLIYEYDQDPTLSPLIGMGYGGMEGAYTGKGRTGKYLLRANTNWVDETFEFMQPNYTNSVSFSGGVDKVRYYVSAGSYNQQGYLRYGNDKYNRYNFSSKLEFDINNWLTLTSLTKVNAIRSDIHEQDGSGGMWHSIWRMPAYTPIWTPDGDYFAYRGETSSIPWMIDGGRDKTQEDNIYQTIGHKIKIDDTNIKINGDVTYGRTSSFRKRHFKSVDMIDSGSGNMRTFNPTNSVTESFAFNNYWAINEYAEYENTINEQHYLKLMAGMNMETQNSTSPSVTGRELLNNDIPYLGLAAGTITAGEGYSDWAIWGFVSRVNYIYKDKYLFEFNGRYDGTSRFPSQNRWKFFPSFSAGWRVSEESFMDWSNEFLNNLKLRASYGSLGNQSTASGSYPYISTYSTGTQSGYIFDDPQQPPRTVNPGGYVYSNLKWQTTETVDFGFDLTLLNKLNANFDYYVRNSRDNLAPNKGIPNVIGASAPLQNKGDIQTKGWEISLRWDDRIQDFKYGVGFVLSDYRSTVTKYDNPTGTLSTLYEGQKFGEIWGYKTNGLIQTQEQADNSPNTDYLYSKFGRQPGDILFVDLNDDDKIDKGDYTLENSGDWTVIGNSTPRYSFGLTLNAEWKGFDFSTFFQGIGKQDRWMSSFMLWGFSDSQWQGSSQYVVMNAWRAEDILSPDGEVILPKNTTDAKLPRNAAYGKHWNQKHPSEFMLQDASYIRWKNLTVGYTLPKKLTQKAGISKLRIYASGQNLWEWTKMIEVIDPEMSGSAKVYPIYRNYSVGVNVSF